MRFAMCNEVLGARQSLNEWWRICAFLSACGYEGIEVAPFTLAESVEEINSTQRHELKTIADEHGLSIVALHWLLVSPPGLHLHAKDNATRQRTRDYLAALIDFAGDLGTPVMVLGSNRQRYLEDGDFSGAWARTLETFHSLTDHLSARDVILCPEALPAPDCDFIQTTAQAQQLIREVNHPHVRLMLDAKSLSSESVPPAETIRAVGQDIAHFHANDANRLAPGYGDTDFVAIAQALRDVEYKGWVSVEPFDYWPDPEILSRDTISYLHRAFGG